LLKFSDLKGRSSYSTNSRKTRSTILHGKTFKDFRVDLCVRTEEAQKDAGTLEEAPKDCESA